MVLLGNLGLSGREEHLFSHFYLATKAFKFELACFAVKYLPHIVSIVSGRLLVAIHQPVHIVLVDPAFTLALWVKVDENERLAELYVALGFLFQFDHLPIVLFLLTFLYYIF